MPNKYDMSPTQCAATWRTLERECNVCCHFLELFNHVGKDVPPADTEALLRLLDAAASRLHDAADAVEALAPMFADNRNTLSRMSTRAQEATERLYAQRLAPPQPTAERILMRLHALADTIDRFDLDTELELIANSHIYRTRTRGVRRWIGGRRERFETEIARRTHWHHLLEPTKVAIDDDALSDFAAQQLADIGFQEFVSTLIVAALLGENTSTHRFYTDHERAQAIRATLEELGKPTTPYMLGIWFVWQQLLGLADATYKSFVEALASDTYFGPQAAKALPISPDSQFRKRHRDPYLSRTDPDDWQLQEWQDHGKADVSKTQNYLGLMQTAAESFRRHLADLG